MSLLSVPGVILGSLSLGFPHQIAHALLCRGVVVRGHLATVVEIAHNRIGSPVRIAEGECGGTVLALNVDDFEAAHQKKGGHIKSGSASPGCSLRGVASGCFYHSIPSNPFRIQHG